MRELVDAVVINNDSKADLQELISSRLKTTGRTYFLRNEILQSFQEYCQEAGKPPHYFHSSDLGKLLHYSHELILETNHLWLLIRPQIGRQEVWQLSTDLRHYEQRTPQALLEVRDRQAHRPQPDILEIDFQPFYADTPTIYDPRRVGQGLSFLNHYLCDKLFVEPHYWLEAMYQVLQWHHYDDKPLLISDSIQTGDDLYQQLQQAILFLRERSGDEAYASIHTKMQALGFEPGWGNTVAQVRETLELLDRLIDTPEPAFLEAFVARIPAMFRIVLVSVHGWVGQNDVMGRPETRSQVAYVLEQARHLENQLRQALHQAGLDVLGIQPQVVILTRLIPNCEGTNCNLRLEKIDHTEQGWILRVPFRDFNPQVTQNWITRYEIWPYLEPFATDAEAELLKLLGGPPDLIIGNYSDGNLVAFLLAQRLKSIQCNIAHGLEKSKYLFSDLLWQEWEDRYHFSAQFTADLIGMNAANFIITSSYQEILGTPETLGQYESYKHFTMPQLYHVVDGIDLFSPKFNTVLPGVNQDRFFPYTQERDSLHRSQIQDLLFHCCDSHILGKLKEPEKRPMLAIASISALKNLAGLAECFGRSPELQSHCNLILVTTHLEMNPDINPVARPDEATEMARLHEMLDRYQLYDRVRWLGMPLPHRDLGEIYRAIADRQGFFVHFARFEAFGQTILEAMASGLPVFATQFGGSLEIIQEGDNGFGINPTDLEGSAAKILAFIQQCQANPDYWQQLSTGAIQRIQQHYNWTVHARQVLLLAKIYAFWNYIYRDGREALLRYVEALFHLIYKPRAAAILAQHQQR